MVEVKEKFLRELEKGGYDPWKKDYMNEWDSYEKKTPEEVKYILPFSYSIIIVCLIWALLYPYTKFDIRVLIILLLLVEIPIAVIEIYLTYIYKVVKMRPTSSYEIENIDDYLQAHEQSQKGNYDYETIKSEKDIINAYENGKKIVFTARQYIGPFSPENPEKGPMWIAIIFWIVCTTIIFTTTLWLVTVLINIEFLLILSISITIFGIFGGMGSILFLLNFINLKRWPRSFFVLGREGIVYRRKWGDIRSYSWKELYLKIYIIKRIPRLWVNPFSMFALGLDLGKVKIPPTPEIHITLPNRAKLKFKPEWCYHLDEFLSFDKVKAEQNYLDTKYSILSRSKIDLEARNFTLYLVGKVFEYYFNSGKKSSS